MRALGIIGGIGPESTVDYYRSIIALWRERVPGADNPPLLINSIALHKMLALVASPELSFRFCCETASRTASRSSTRRRFTSKLQ